MARKSNRRITSSANEQSVDETDLTVNDDERLFESSGHLTVTSDDVLPTDEFIKRQKETHGNRRDWVNQVVGLIILALIAIFACLLIYLNYDKQITDFAIQILSTVTGAIIGYLYAQRKSE